MILRGGGAPAPSCYTPSMPSAFQIRSATVDDVAVILQLIRELAEYERAPNDAIATAEGLREVLFGEKPAAEVLLAFEHAEPVGFAVYFFNFSTWLGRPGLYLEDLFVRPDMRAKGYGRALLQRLRPQLAGLPEPQWQAPHPPGPGQQRRQLARLHCLVVWPR